MRKWHAAERRRAAERHAKAAAAPSTVGISKRPERLGERREGEGGEGGRGGGASYPRDSSIGLAIIVLKVWAFQWPSQASVTPPIYLPCCVLSPVPLMHLIPFMSPFEPGHPPVGDKHHVYCNMAPPSLAITRFMSDRNICSYSVLVRATNS